MEQKLGEAALFIYINSIHVSLVLFTNRQPNNARLLDAFIFTE